MKTIEVRRNLVKTGLKQMGANGLQRAIDFYAQNPDRYYNQGELSDSDRKV